MTPVDDLIVAYHKLYRENSRLRLRNLQLTQQLKEAQMKQSDLVNKLIQAKQAELSMLKALTLIPMSRQMKLRKVLDIVWHVAITVAVIYILFKGGM